MTKYEYLALDNNSDELQHWKYIKKYKNSAGKWTYVYADKKTHNKLKEDEEGSWNRARLARGPQGDLDNSMKNMLYMWYDNSFEEFNRRKTWLARTYPNMHLHPEEVKIKKSSKELGKAYSDIRKTHEYRERTLKQRDVKYLINKTLTKTKFKVSNATRKAKKYVESLVNKFK